MKLLTRIYRCVTFKCTYCGRRLIYHEFDIMQSPFKSCPTDSRLIRNYVRTNPSGCSGTQRFISSKEVKVQKALGLWKFYKTFNGTVTHDHIY